MTPYARLRAWAAFALACLVFSPGAALAYSGYGRKGVGTSGAPFLRLGVNARAVAMGEAYSAVADGSDAIHWNPAGLERVRNKAASFLHAVYFQGLFYDFASYAQRTRWGTFAGSFHYMGVPAIESTDAFGAPAGTFRPYNMSASVAWARRIDGDGIRRFSVGASIKVIRSRIVESAQGAAADLGVAYSLVRPLRFAVAVQNLGPAMRFAEDGDELPLNVKVGSSFRPISDWLFAVDANFPRDNNPEVSLGSEYSYDLSRTQWAALRAGFASRSVRDLPGLSTLSAGAGFGWRGTGLDFAWAPFGVLGDSYRFSLSLNF